VAAEPALVEELIDRVKLQKKQSIKPPEIKPLVFEVAAQR
jgi:hypothetical protein